MTTDAAASRREIQNWFHRYTRGVDRLDRELLLSAYHPDAIDDHGIIVAGPVQFVDWLIEFHRKNQITTQHYLMNHQVEIDGNVAHGETYFIYVAVNTAFNSPLSVRGGRYVDQFECRDDRWAIAARVCLTSWRTEFPRLSAPPEWDVLLQAGPVESRDRDDISYQRPLRTRAMTIIPPDPENRRG